MESAEGTMGRVFVLRLDEGEDLLEILTEYAREKDIKAGFLHLLGATKKADLVSMEDSRQRPYPTVKLPFDTPLEVVGTGNIFWNDEGPMVHIHLVGGGRKSAAFSGCLRDHGIVTYFVEVVIYEILGLSALREHDPDLGVHRISFS